MRSRRWMATRSGWSRSTRRRVTTHLRTKRPFGVLAKEAGFVDDEEVLVLEDGADFEGDSLFGRNRAVEEVEPAGDDWVVPAHRQPRLVAHVSIGQQGAAGLGRLGEFGLEPLPDRVGNGQVILRVGGLPTGVRSAVAEMPSRGGSGLRGMGPV